MSSRVTDYRERESLRLQVRERLKGKFGRCFARSSTQIVEP
jgi:hypothetical protein